jgi:pimeloyl-ACP methyl ester carboxylesterase
VPPGGSAVRVPGGHRPTAFRLPRPVQATSDHTETTRASRTSRGVLEPGNWDAAELRAPSLGGSVRVVAEGLQLGLRDGRMLGYAEYGDPGGRPLVFLHGFPGSRLAGEILDEAARTGGVRVLAPERPGLGLSSPQPRRTLLETVQDVEALTDALGIGRFTVLGESGGGPYALACAHELPDRLDGVAVVCGLGPVAGSGATVGIAFKERLGYAAAARAPLLAARLLVPVGVCARKWPRQFLRLTRWQLGEADCEVLDGPLGDLVAADFAEALRQGSRGVAQDLALLFRPWPFDPRAIRAPVTFFHGARDRTVSVAVAHELARTVPGSQLRIHELDGHFSLLAGNPQEILEQITLRRERALNAWAYRSSATFEPSRT